MNKINQAAKAYIEAGLSVLPVSSDTKAPLVPKGVDWKSEEFTGAERLTFVDKYFGEKQHLGVGLCCGAPSGNLYVFDFDNHQGDAKEIFESFCNIAEVEDVLEEIKPYIVATKTGGYHIAIRTKTPRKTEKIARRKIGKKIDCHIESRAEGGYVVTYPTKGYFLLSGSPESVPTANEEQFDILYSAALTFNEYVTPQDEYSHSRFEQDSFSERPGDIYNEKLDAIDETKALLQQNGWSCDKTGRYWTRPNKKKGISATYGKIAPNVFYNFSSSAGTFEDRKAYKPFQLLALLKHNGNFGDAAHYIIDKYNLKSAGNPTVKRIYGVARESIRRGQTLTSGEINDLAEANELPVNEVAKHVKAAEKKYENESDLNSKKDIEKAEIFLQNHYEFRLDVISKLTQMRRNGEQWQDINVNTVYRDIQHEGVKFKMENLKSLLKSDFVQAYNPFQEYFHNCKSWDGKDYIGELCNYVEVENNDYFRAMLEKALVRTIACALIPEYYNRMVFVLQAEGQEIGKSYFIMYLNPFKTAYYTDEPLKDNKDSRFALTENFIYNLEELDGLSRMELSHMKATISTRGVKDRVAYGTHKEYFPRCASFWGSTNRREFLNDDRNTRWLIFAVKSFDWEYSKNVDVNNVWAQAWHLFNKKDYNRELTQAEASMRDTRNEEFRVIDYEHSLLTKHFEASETDFMTNAEILESMNRALGGGIKLNTNAMKLGKLLSTLGYQRAKDGNQRGWRIKYNDKTPNPYSAFDDDKPVNHSEPKKDIEDLPF